MGKISTATEAAQLCIPRSLGRAPLARHYFMAIKGFGLYKRRTCGRAAPRGITQGEERRGTGKRGPPDIKSPHSPSSPLSAAGPSLPSLGAAARGLGNLSLFVLSRPFWTTFYVFIQAICSPGKGKRLLRLPAPRPLLALLCPATVPLPPASARPGPRRLALARRDFISA